MPFHDLYQVKSGDNLTKIGRGFGYSNPGPIVAYPPNQAKFRNRSPNLIWIGESFLIPWHPDLLRKIIATSNYLISETIEQANKMINVEHTEKKDLERYLFLIDAINLLASLHVSIGSLSANYIRGVEITSKDLILWLVEFQAGIASGITTLVIPSPDMPKKDFKFFVRHALGPWNPSFWASVYAAVKEKDVDIYLYGADAVTYKNSMRIKKQAEEDISRLDKKIQEARIQLSMPFYRHRI